MAKKINRALIQDILSKGDGVKSVSSEAVNWVIAVAEHTARQLAASGRRTPAGRLMAPKMDPGLQSRQMMREPQPVDAATQALLDSAPCGAELVVGGPRRWTDYNDWQTAVRSDATKLKFEEWKEKQK